jgi:hypothetical protein
MMTNAELNQLSIIELRALNHKVCEMIRLKQQIEGKMNADNLKIGMPVKFTGDDKRIKNQKFTVLKINKTRAQCKNHITGAVWNLTLANIEPCGEIELDLLGMLERNPEGFQK